MSKHHFVRQPERTATEIEAENQLWFAALRKLPEAGNTPSRVQTVTLCQDCEEGAHAQLFNTQGCPCPCHGGR